jgi:hypothetical protein
MLEAPDNQSDTHVKPPQTALDQRWMDGSAGWTVYENCLNVSVSLHGNFTFESDARHPIDVADFACLVRSSWDEIEIASPWVSMVREGRCSSLP